MSDEDWENSDVTKMAEHISLKGTGPTEYEVSRELNRSSPEDKMTGHWLESLDDSDPALS